MRGFLLTMRSDPGNLCLEQGNPLAKLMVREAVERLRRQLAGQIACTARALVKFHRYPLCDRLSLAVNRLHGYLAQRAVYDFPVHAGLAGSVQGGMA